MQFEREWPRRSFGRKEGVVKSGSCMCGAVTFRVSCALKPPDACHCTQCRKFSGHYSVGTDVPRSAVDISGAENITWYYSSPKVRRGFCAHCGCSMFFDPPAQDWIGISMGAFDGPPIRTPLCTFSSRRKGTTMTLLMVCSSAHEYPSNSRLARDRLSQRAG